jgi:hypothetical protein
MTLNKVDFAEGLRPAVERAIREGCLDARSMAREFNAQGLKTRAGGRWNQGAIKKLTRFLDQETET